jgi:hypothetical protein
MMWIYFFNFIPYDQTSGVGIYSGAGRWTFFQATFVPASFSVLVHAGNSNFQNKIITQTAGGDLITGVDVDPFSFYFGLGFIHGQGQFSSTLTSDLLAANQVATSFHTVMGLNISISDMFLAFEIDSYSKIMLGLKIGARL